MKDIEEAKVGSGTAVADKSAEKRAQLSLKMVQLRMKQNKEREALAAQRKSLQKEETMTESFSASQIAALKAEYSKINTIDPSSDTYKKLIAMLDKLDLKSLKSLADANVKFVSKLAQNRVLRKSMKKEDVQLDEISTKLLAKAAHAASDPDADYHYGKSHDPQKFADRAKKTKDAKSAAAVQGAADAKGHYTRPGHTLGSYDKLAHRSPARVTSAGKANKQDVNKLKKSISLKVEEVESIDELSTNKLADYKKKAGADASAADKAGDMKRGNKRFSGIIKATKKQFDNDVKSKTEELLSPKQKEIDKNKNGKIDGFDLAAIRNKKKPQGADFAAQRRKERLASNGRMDEGKSDYEIYHKDYSSAVQTAIKQAEKRGFEVDMDDWHDKVATGPKKPSAGKTNSFSVKLKKDGKESKKALHLQVYNMDNHKYELNMYIEEVQLDELNKDTLYSYVKKSEKDQDIQLDKLSRALDNKKNIAKAVAAFNKNSHKFANRSAGQERAEKRLAKEAASPAQQAAIAIDMKKAGKKPKNMKESLVDKIKAMKRGAEAKAKADDHFDKAGDPKNANASKDLKKAVRYHNLLNKEEVVMTEAKKKTFKDVKKKMKEETPNNASVKKGEPLTGKKEPIEINPELKEEVK